MIKLDIMDNEVIFFFFLIFENLEYIGEFYVDFRVLKWVKGLKFDRR